MGWFWDSKKDGSPSDPYNNLDPSLRDFLKKESASTNETRTADTTSITRSSQPSNTPQTNYRSQLGLESQEAPRNDTASRVSQVGEQAVPPQSQFPDGRYAHLWKDYRPLQEVEDAGKSDSDRLADIGRAYKQRQAEIARAALENCVELNIAVQECFLSGNWQKTMSMCKVENRAFNRCFEMQSRFLKALGFIALQRTPEEEEKIQMHADKLYNEMLERERLVKEAKEKGLDEPVLPSLIQPQKVSEVLGRDSAFARARERAKDLGMTLNLSSFAPEKQAEIKERIKNMSKDQQDLELQLIAAESRAAVEYAERFAAEMELEKLHRRDRRERGKETIGDTIKRWAGWEQ